MDENNDFIAGYIRLEWRGKVHRTEDYKDRGTIFKDYTRSGKIVGIEFLRPNDFWRFIKALVAKDKKGKKNAPKN